MLKNTLITALFLLSGAGFANAQQTPPQSDYIRFVDGEPRGVNSQLQISVESYTKNGVTVDLYGVVHMADASYYQAVQRDLNAYDTVLYEGVRQGATPNQETVGLRAIQAGMSRVLGLQYQMDGISYVGTNMVHADIDAATLERNLQGEKLTPFGGMIDPSMVDRLKPFIELIGVFLDQWLASNPGIQNSMKHQFASSMGTTDVSAQLSPQMKQAIIDDRNQIVMNVLAAQLRDHPTRRRIAIFYGAAHNMDFSARLQRQGYTRGSRRWMTAWEIGQTQAEGGGGLFGDALPEMRKGLERGLGDSRDKLRGPERAKERRKAVRKAAQDRRLKDAERRELERQKSKKVGAGK